MEFEPTGEKNSLSVALDSGKGNERTWKKLAWKIAGYGAIALLAIWGLSKL